MLGVSYEVTLCFQLFKGQKLQFQEGEGGRGGGKKAHPPKITQIYLCKNHVLRHV